MSLPQKAALKPGAAAAAGTGPGSGVAAAAAAAAGAASPPRLPLTRRRRRRLTPTSGPCRPNRPSKSPEVLFSSPSRIGSSLRPSPLCTAL
ncbi:unnamed protein product [Bubo scandiacus]